MNGHRAFSFRLSLAVWIAAACAGSALLRADERIWDVKYQPDHGRNSVRYALVFNRPHCREAYFDQYLNRRRASDRNASMERTPEVLAAVRQQFRADCDTIFEMLDRSTKMFGEWGLKPPGLKPIMDEQGKEYLPVFLMDFGHEPKKWEGVAGQVKRTKNADGSLGQFCVLRLNVFRLCAYRQEEGSIQSFLPTVAHELFHAIQWHYCPLGEPWFKESTAAWAANAVVQPQISHAKHMNRFLLYPHLPLSYDVADPAVGYLDLSKHGHPYGAAVWFHFLNRQRPDDSRRVVLETMRGHHHDLHTTALAAFSAALGDSQTLGPKFRELHDRFAVGALLTVNAPDHCQAEGVEKFSAPRAVLLQKIAHSTDERLRLSKVFSAYHDRIFTAPETAVLEVNFAGTTRAYRNGVLTLPVERGGMGGCGVRFFEVSVPATAPASSALDVFIKVPEQEVSLQAVWHDGAAYRISPANYDASSEGYRLHLPVKSVADRRFDLVLTRYSEEEPLKAYPLRLACADPPALRSIKITQGTPESIVIWGQWSDQQNADGRLVSRMLASHGTKMFDPKGGPMKVQLVFTSPVTNGDQAICRFGDQDVPLQPEQGDSVFSGEIPGTAFANLTTDVSVVIRALSKLPGTKVQLPLDADPATVAQLTGDLTSWKDYERDQPFQVTLKTKQAKKKAEYEGMVYDGSRLWKPDETAAGDSRKVLKSSAYVFIELDTGTVGGNLNFSREREAGKAAADRYKTNLFSHVAYNWKVPESANGEVIVVGDAKFEAVYEDGPDVWSEKAYLALFRGDNLAIPGYPEIKNHFLVWFQNKPDRNTLDQILQAEGETLPPSVRAVLLPLDE